MNLLIEDKRKFERLPAEFSATIEHDGSMGREVGVVNVSAAGALLNSPVFLANDLPVNFSLHLDNNGDYHNLGAKILRATPILGGKRYAIAIRFDEEQHGLVRAVKAAKLGQKVSARKPSFLASRSKKRGRMASRVSSRLANKKWLPEAR